MRTNTMKLFGVAALVAFGLASCADVPTEAKKGCLDPQAVNYDSEATEDGGGCVTIQQKQFSLFFKYTATWCGPCGDWGAPAFEQVYNSERGKILAFTIQTTDDFTTPANDSVKTQFAGKWNYGGTPNFVVNDNMLGTGYGAGIAEIDTKYTTAPVAGVGIHYTVGAGPNAGKLNINAYTKFFQQASGDYYLGVYILHKNIVKPQNVDAAYVNDFTHHHVLMSPVTNVFGNKVAGGSIASGQVFNQGYVFSYTDIPGLNLNAMEVVGVLYKKVGASFEVVNVTPN